MGNLIYDCLREENTGRATTTLIKMVTFGEKQDGGAGMGAKLLCGTL